MSKSFDDRCAAYCDLCKRGIGEIYRVTDKDDNYALQFHPQRWVHMRDELGWSDCEAADIREVELLTRLLTEAVSMVRDLAGDEICDHAVNICFCGVKDILTNPVNAELLRKVTK